jgi:hypothetical protein
MEFCDVVTAERAGQLGARGNDLWCRTHHMWVYLSANSELLNEQHEKVRWPEDSPLHPQQVQPKPSHSSSPSFSQLNNEE